MDGGTRARTARAISPGTRVAVCAGAGLAIALVVAFVAPWQIAVLAGWNAALAIYVGWVWLTVGRMDAAATKAIAMSEDLSHLAAELVLLSASVVNLAVVGSALVASAGRSALVGSIINGASVLSVALSWAVVHTVYALRYARLYYELGGGIDIEGGPPDYRDFAYVAFTVGMTYQIADTTLTAKQMRRTALGHMLLSYLFGAVIVATVINVIAGFARG